MSYEIELKAWVDDQISVKTKLSKIAGFDKEFIKEDVYWIPNKEHTQAIPPLGVRVRKESTVDKSGVKKSCTLVTYKTKEVRGGIEINDEKEFEICSSNAQYNSAFEELLRRFGLTEGINKRKDGFSFNYNGINAELSLVKGLGWFLELEIMAEDNYEKTILSSKEKLFDLLNKAGITHDKIETRYYAEMLKELQEKK